MKPQFYVIDGLAVAKSVGLLKHVNMVMQTAFFKVCDVLPVDQATALLKASIAKTYASKGPEVRKTPQTLSFFKALLTIFRAGTRSPYACPLARALVVETKSSSR